MLVLLVVWYCFFDLRSVPRQDRGTAVRQTARWAAAGRRGAGLAAAPDRPGLPLRAAHPAVAPLARAGGPGRGRPGELRGAGGATNGCCGRCGPRSWRGDRGARRPGARARRRAGGAHLRLPRLITGLVLLPLFVPGVAMGVASALGFRLLGMQPSLLTIVTVQVVWALPFAFLVVLTAMAGFDPVYPGGGAHVRCGAVARLPRGGAADDPRRAPGRPSSP